MSEKKMTESIAALQVGMTGIVDALMKKGANEKITSLAREIFVQSLPLEAEDLYQWDAEQAGDLALHCHLMAVAFFSKSAELEKATDENLEKQEETGAS